VTRKDVQTIAMTAAIAATASTLTGLLIAYLIDRAREARQLPMTPEEIAQAKAQAFHEAQQQWLAGMGRCWY
jgi:membrane protein YqaA with SNARE-associated domain